MVLGWLFINILGLYPDFWALNFNYSTETDEQPVGYSQTKTALRYKLKSKFITKRENWSFNIGKYCC
jgi:hypothetical protein